MKSKDEVSVLYEGGVLKPDRDLDLPDHTRLIIAIRRVETTPESELRGRRSLHEIRESGCIQLRAWYPSREELHERR